MFPSRVSHPWPIRLIMLAVLAWGIWLAVGAYLGNVKLYHLDVRKGAVVLTCVLGFLGLWAGALMWTRPRHAVSPATDDDDAHGTDDAVEVPYSKPCLASFLIALITTGSATAILAARGTMPSYSGWGMAASAAVATLTAMVGLSDPSLKRGKWMAMLTLLIMGLLVLAWLLFPRQLNDGALPDSQTRNSRSAPELCEGRLTSRRVVPTGFPMRQDCYLLPVVSAVVEGPASSVDHQVSPDGNSARNVRYRKTCWSADRLTDRIHVWIRSNKLNVDRNKTIVSWYRG